MKLVSAFAAIAVLVFSSFVTAWCQSKTPEQLRVDSLFSEWDKPTSPGCALGVIRDGSFVYQRGYGMANLENHTAISPSSVFDIGSTSKQFAAACIVLLQQQGKLSVDDEVRKYIPELPDYGKPITIRHLLNHTSGLRDYPSLMELAGYQLEMTTGRQEALDIISKQKALNFNPGDEWLYSNTGFFLASVIVERVSGKTLNEFATENIFKPLGMNSTMFLDDHTKIVPNRAIGYEPRESGGFKINMSNWEQTGDGAVQTSIEDLKLWDANFYDPKVGGQALIQALTTVGKFNDGKSHEYGFGLSIDKYKGLDRVSHGGAWAGYRAQLARFPKEKLSVVCLCNLGSMSPSALAMKVADIYLADKIAKPKKENPAAAKNAYKIKPAELARYEGSYRRPSDEFMRKITLKDGKLYYVRGPGNESVLVPLAKDKFTWDDQALTATFTTDAKGVVNGFDLSGTPSSHLELFTPVTLTGTQLNEYEGSFYSAELDVTYTSFLQADQVNMKTDRMTVRPLTPIVKDTFTCSLGTIKFTRDGKNAVDGFTLSQGRARGIVFRKK
jgi:CubicO group peptidase (beta-lactamase class C family)